MSRLNDFIEGITSEQATCSFFYAVITHVITPPKKVKCNYKFRCNNYRLAKEEGFWELQKELCNVYADTCKKCQKFGEEDEVAKKLKIGKAKRSPYDTTIQHEHLSRIGDFSVFPQFKP